MSAYTQLERKTEIDRKNCDVRYYSVKAKIQNATVIDNTYG